MPSSLSVAPLSRFEPVSRVKMLTQTLRSLERDGLLTLTDPELVHAILRHLGLPTTPPPLSPARAPPHHQLDLHFDGGHLLEMDQTPGFDPTEPEPVPDHDFDPA